MIESNRNGKKMVCESGMSERASGFIWSEAGRNIFGKEISHTGITNPHRL